jgi:hypothetical protein
LLTSILQKPWSDRELRLEAGSPVIIQTGKAGDYSRRGETNLRGRKSTTPGQQASDNSSQQWDLSFLVKLLTIDVLAGTRETVLRHLDRGGKDQVLKKGTGSDYRRHSMTRL